MFKALFYPWEVKFYTDNVRASVTNSMSGSTVNYSSCQCSAVQFSVLLFSAVRYSVVQYNTVKCSAIQCSTVSDIIHCSEDDQSEISLCVKPLLLFRKSITKLKVKTN